MTRENVSIFGVWHLKAAYHHPCKLLLGQAPNPKRGKELTAKREI
jgi:hypothetical protein